MSWSTRTFFSGGADGVADAIAGGLPGVTIGERLARLDRLRPSVEWWTLPIRGGMLDEVVHLTTVKVHPGTRVTLRSPEWSLRVARRITERAGGFGGVLVQDRAQHRYGRGLAYAGRMVEAVVAGDSCLRLDLGRAPGVSDEMRVASASEASNQAHWVDWLEKVTGLTTFEIDQAYVRRPPVRHLYALEPAGPLSDGWVPEVRGLRTIAALFVDPETWDAVAPSLPEGWSGTLRLTPPRLDQDTFKKQTMSYAVVHHEGPADLDALDALAVSTRCNATAVEVAGEGAPTRWWDWERGSPMHAGEVLGASDFIEVWGALAVVLETNPHVFTARWRESR